MQKTQVCWNLKMNELKWCVRCSPGLTLMVWGGGGGRGSDCRQCLGKSAIFSPPNVLGDTSRTVVTTIDKITFENTGWMHRLDTQHYTQIMSSDSVVRSSLYRVQNWPSAGLIISPTTCTLDVCLSVQHNHNPLSEHTNIWKRDPTSTSVLLLYLAQNRHPQDGGERTRREDVILILPDRETAHVKFLSKNIRWQATQCFVPKGQQCTWSFVHSFCPERFTKTSKHDRLSNVKYWHWLYIFRMISLATSFVALLNVAMNRCLVAFPICTVTIIW